MSAPPEPQPYKAPVPYEDRNKTYQNDGYAPYKSPYQKPEGYDPYNNPSNAGAGASNNNQPIGGGGARMGSGGGAV